MPNKRLLAALGVTAALAAGGAAAVIGAPGISGAQTTDSPTTTVPGTPAPDQDAPAGRDRNCPDKGEGGERPAPAPGAAQSGATNTGARTRGGGRLL
ncbi:MAG: hypothetical protein ACRD12_23570 [Acidimicrobiales bacterium]